MATVHTCKGKPDHNGRIVPDCDGCYERAYHEGRYTGGTYALNALIEALQDRINVKYDVVSISDKNEALAKWREARRILDMTTVVVEDIRGRIDRPYNALVKLEEASTNGR